MRPRLPFLAAILCLFCPIFASAQSTTLAERLGYPRDAKLLILHADDLAVAHSVDSASFDALDSGLITSASIMVPCPWLTEVADYAKTHPDADLGLHLTLTSEWRKYRWGTVAPSDTVASLLDRLGTLWPDSPQFAQHAKPEDAEREIRAQVERAIAAGIHPTHLDSHMLSLYATPEFFSVYAKVAHDYHLPFLAVRLPDHSDRTLSALTDKDIVLNSVIIAAPGIPRDHWIDFYLNAIKGLQPGLSEIIVHLGHDDAELQAITVGFDDYGSAWRQRDFEAINNPEFKKALQENHIVLVKWKDLQKLVR
jgi:chitin disaccharide deacetylase